MKETYGITDYDENKKVIDRCKYFRDKMSMIPVDFASFNVDSMGTSLYRIFIYSVEGDFTEEQLRLLRTLLNTEFNIQNTVVNEGISVRSLYEHVWQKDIREDTGKIHWTRIIREYVKNPNSDLYLLIENAPLGNCKLVKEEITKTVFKMDCKN